jgi:hypothetical protein
LARHVRSNDGKGARGGDRLRLTASISFWSGHTGVPARCSASDLRLDLGQRISEPTGQHTLFLAVTNTSVGCHLFGYPGISLIDASGNALPLEYVHTRPGGDWRGARLVDLKPGAKAYVSAPMACCGAGPALLTAVPSGCRCRRPPDHMGKQRVAGRDPGATREPGRDVNLPNSGEDEHGDAQAWGVLMAVVEVIGD